MSSEVLRGDVGCRDGELEKERHGGHGDVGRALTNPPMPVSVSNSRRGGLERAEAVASRVAAKRAGSAAQRRAPMGLAKAAMICGARDEG